MAVVAVRPVRVGMLDVLMSMLVSVGFRLRKNGVSMIMMTVPMGMEMGMERPFMAMPMAVMFFNQKPCPGGHEKRSREH